MRVLHKKDIELEAAEKLLKEINVLKSQYFMKTGNDATHIEMTSEEYNLLKLLCYPTPSDASKKVYDLEIIIKD